MSEFHTTSPESELVLRWLDAKNPSRDNLDQTEDMACIYGIADNCPGLDLREVKLLGELACKGGGKEILKLVADARAGRRLEF